MHSQEKADSQSLTTVGCFRFYPKSLQQFGSAPYFLFSLCVFVVLQSMVVTGLIPVILSTIELRYSLNSKESGFIISWNDCVNAVAVIFITHYGHRAHIPLWLGRGMIVFGVGCFLFALPQFLSDEYKPSDSIYETCSSSTLAGLLACSSNLKKFYSLFILGQFFLALGSVPLYTLAVTFIDDNVSPDKNSTYLGVFFMFAALGPALGFLLGGLFLDTWVEPGASTTLSPNSAQWIGNWWACFLLCGGLCLILSPLLLICPFQLPGTEWIREMRSKQVVPKAPKQDELVVGATSTPASTSTLAPSVPAVQDNTAWFGLRNALLVSWSLCKNKPYLFTQLGAAAESLVVVGVGAFLPKIVATQFLLTAANASFLTGISVIGGVASGILVGGLISRRWTPLQNSRNTATLRLSFVSLLFTACCLMHCSPISLVGSSVPYSLDNSSAVCNGNCSCSAFEYKPVCSSSGHTYLTACLAGCRSSTGFSYSNCSCLPSLGEVVTDGKCRSGCDLLPVFLVTLLLFMFITFVYQVPTTIFTIRCVHESQRSLAMGLSSLSHLPGAGVHPWPFDCGGCAGFELHLVGEKREFIY